MDIFRQIAEQKISEAMARGEFDNLSCKGTRLDLRDDPYAEADLRMGYKILKNAGVVPEELALGRDIRSLPDLLQNCSDHDPELRKKLRSKILQLNLLLERRGRSAALQDYLAKLEILA